MAKKIATFRADGKLLTGWLDGCPDFVGVFFGDVPSGARYVSPRDGSDLGGHVEFTDLTAAQRFAAGLAKSGDWTVKAPGHPSVGEVHRPEYAVTEVVSEE